MKRLAILLFSMFALSVAPLRAETTNTERENMPIQLTARDFITKVYGVISPQLSKDAASDQAFHILNVRPVEDEYGLWIETDDGYLINYYGMIPEVSARAAYGPTDALEEYGYFFLFPYSNGDRETANAEQSQFSGTLLQELLDMGLKMQVDDLSDALFEVNGDYDNDSIDVKLVEEHNTADNTGRFILILHVEPDASYTAAE